MTLPLLLILVQQRVGAATQCVRFARLVIQCIVERFDLVVVAQCAAIVATATLDRSDTPKHDRQPIFSVKLSPQLSSFIR